MGTRDRNPHPPVLVHASADVIQEADVHRSSNDVAQQIPPSFQRKEDVRSLGCE